MPSLEPVELKLTLSGTYWDKKPKARVYINDTVIFDDEVSETPVDVRWTGELSEGGHELIVELYDKDKYQTVLQNNHILKDQLLNIDSVSFDDIDISYLKHSLSKYEHDDQVELKCVNLGCNGKWKLTFQVPIYIWLLENL
jgi:hypothetical protein